MQAILGYIIGALTVVCAFGFIIFIHELGHFLAARWVDIRCPQFAIGFGPSLASFRRRGTNFAVRLFPLGGYVLMNGEEPSNRSEDPWVCAVVRYLGGAAFPATPVELLAILERVPRDERTQAWLEVHDQVAYARCKNFPTLRSVEGNFNDRSIPARFLVISGGVIMNFLAATILLWGLSLFSGVGYFFQDWGAVVSQVVPSSPAEKAGVAAGTWLLEVDGKPVGTRLEAYYAIGAHPGEPIELRYRTKSGVEQSKTVTPWLAVGSEVYSVADDDSLVLKQSREFPDLVDKEVETPGRAQLVALLSSAAKPDSYSVTFKGQSQPTTFKLPSGAESPRGLIGIQFGHNNIRFENRWTGVVSSVEPGSPADKAGLKAGDNFVAVAGLPVMANNGFVLGSLVDEAFRVAHRIPQLHKVEVVVLRDNKEHLLTFESKEASGQQEAGIALAPLSAKDKLIAPFSLIGTLTASPYIIFQRWLNEEATGTEIVQSMQGPIGIMQLLYEISKKSIVQLALFLAVLNAAVGGFNLLPFPALDGSRLVFLVVAAVRGKAVDPDKEARIHLAGLLLLLGFMLVVSFGDIKRLISAEMFFM